MTDQEKLAAANALDEAYARAEAFDRAQLPTRTVYQVMWDIGHSCDVFPPVYDTEEAAQAEADSIEYEYKLTGHWDDECCYEVIAVEIPIEPEPEEDAWAELRRAALNHRGEP